MSDIVMPQLGESVTEGTITRWFKSVGDTVTEDEPLFEVSTDKVDTEVPATGSGVLQEIRVEEGETVDVGTVLGVMGDGAAAPEAPSAEAEAPVTEAPSAPPTEAAPQPAPAADQPPQAAAPPPAPAAPQAAPEAAPEPAPQPPPQPAATSAASGMLLSPLVRRLVEEHNLDPAAIAGTGVGGRITREDVLDAVDAGTASAAVQPPATSAAAPAPGGSAPRPAAPPLVPPHPCLFYPPDT
ncbi:MAG: biotin/lipoyl-containing protein, partial [Microthrixaceae bacterium]